MECLYYSLNDVNSLLRCSICEGYFVEPYTIKECMDTFCRTCILQYFEKHTHADLKCPKCQINLQPFSDISKCLIPDRQFEDIIHSLIPSLEINEIQKEKLFYEQNNLPLPKDLRLKLHVIDSNRKTTLTSTKKSLVPIALQIELCKKFVDSSLTIKQYPRKYLCVNSQLEIQHIRKYIETICQISQENQIYLFFYESCLDESTPLLLIKKLLFPATDRIKLFFSIVSKQ